MWTLRSSWPSKKSRFLIVSPKLPIGIPNPVPYCPIWGHDVVRSVEREKFINAGLSKYVEFWKQVIEESATYSMKMSLYVDYWEDILLHLSKPLLTQRSILLEGFWPSSNYKLDYARTKLPSTKLVVDSEDPIIHPYCGPKSLKLVFTYISFKDLNNGDFVLVRPHDPLLVTVWMGRTQSDVVKVDQNEFFKMVRVQWWNLMKKGSNLDEQCLYEDYWNDKWKCNLVDPK